MPFIPHTDEDVSLMLAAIGVERIDDLFDEIPRELLIDGLNSIPAGASEMAVSRLMHERAARDNNVLNFIGAGAYEHHIPAAVWQLATRGEFYSAYTPYQAEASQGTLQLIYEYQTMMASLTGHEVSNASLYDGASAVAEAILMAVRANRRNKSKTVVYCGGINPTYRQCAHAIVGTQGIEFESLPYDPKTGTTADVSWDAGEAPVAVVIQQPTFFGTLEAVDQITDAAHAAGSMVIAVVNPTSLALLRPPGEWGEKGADIVCGEGQPLGVPLSSGGPYFGFMTSRKALVRQMPGRIVGKTTDLEGKPGYTLTLQAREQHIRRSKATSNICTNQGLAVTAATIYMSLLGAEGLRQVALSCLRNTESLVDRLTNIAGVERVFIGPHFHESVLRVPTDANAVLETLAREGVVGGIVLSTYYPELENCLLVCATETKTADDIEIFGRKLEVAIDAA